MDALPKTASGKIQKREAESARGALMEWDIKTREKFKLMISKMPVFHRRIAEEAVTLKAQENTWARGAAWFRKRMLFPPSLAMCPSRFTV